MKIKDIKEQFQHYFDSEKKRGHSISNLTELLELHKELTALKIQNDKKRQVLKANSKKIQSSSKGIQKDLILQNKALSYEINREKNDIASISKKIEDLMKKIGNLLRDSVPEITETIYEEKENQREFFEQNEIKENCLAGEIELKQSSLVSGHGFYYLTGDYALLELALINLAVQHAYSYNITPISPPVLVRKDAIIGTGYYDNHSDEIYRTEEDNFYLTATSEIPIAALFMNRRILHQELPIRYVGFSNCFRREAGSYGKNDISIHRVHQFNKVELFSFVKEDNSDVEFDRLIEIKKSFLQKLSLPFRIRNINAKELNRGASKKYDFEIYHNGMKKYIEVASISNCLDFQSDNLNITTTDKGKIHTLNGTLCAVPRLIMVLAERPNLIKKLIAPYKENQS